MHDHHGAMSSPVPGWSIIGTLLVILALYIVAAYRSRRSRAPWSPWRLGSFATGIALLAIAVSPPVADAAHSDLRGHMVQHLLIGMFAPLGLVLGAPMTLLLRSVSVEAGRRVAAFLRTRPVHFLSHPLAAAILNIGGMYVLYLTQLFAATMSNPTLHWLVNMHFLAAGYLFAWAIAGPDPAPGRPGMRTRIAVLIVAIGAHAYLGKAMYAHLWPRGADFSDGEIQAAAELMYYGGDIAELLLAIALFASWRRRRRRALERHTAQKNGRLLAPVANAS